MLAIQEYLLAGKTPEDVSLEFGISVYRHPTLPLVGFKYSQIDSPKTHPVVRDCRGTVLEDGSWRVVAKGFRRFFNVGEDAEQFAKFNWDNFTITTKEDGSLMLLYHYQGEWHVNTSGSFGLAECYFSGKTWRDLFWESSKIDRLKLDPEYTYIFEMWTPFNRVIRDYAQPSTFLLSMFHVPTLVEVTVEQADEWAVILGVPRPDHHHFKSKDEIATYLLEMESSDRTYEGVVIRDDANERYKWKTSTYVALHHLVDNGNIYNPKRIVPLVLAGEGEEVLAYLSDSLAAQLRPFLKEVEDRIHQEYEKLLDLWQRTWQIENQKEFALAIVNKSPFTSLLFQIRKENNGIGQSESTLREKWRKSGDLIIKVLYE